MQRPRICLVHLEERSIRKCGIRLAVHGLAAKADDLRSRGARFDRVERTDVGSVLLIDPAHTGGTRFEIVEETAVA